jgi:DNA-binding Lrp family transcriptional regulator
VIDGVDVWEASYRAAELEPKARHILQTLAGRAGLLDSVQISERRLAEETGFSRSVVWGRLQKLEAAGWLRRTPITGQPTLWTLLIPEGAR